MISLNQIKYILQWRILILNINTFFAEDKTVETEIKNNLEGIYIYFGVY